MVTLFILLCVQRFINCFTIYCIYINFNMIIICSIYQKCDYSEAHV